MGPPLADAAGGEREGGGGAGVVMLCITLRIQLLIASQDTKSYFSSLVKTPKVIYLFMMT